MSFMLLDSFRAYFYSDRTFIPPGSLSPSYLEGEERSDQNIKFQVITL